VAVCSGALKDYMEQQGLVASITLTDEDDYAVAFAIVERNGAQQ
jgi:holo-[acyl-carrier protein] synthase